jgi:hypothetical protein
MVLGLTEPLTEMSTRNLPGGKWQPARVADNLATICKPIVQKMLEPRPLTTLWAFMACYRDAGAGTITPFLAFFNSNTTYVLRAVTGIALCYFILFYFSIYFFLPVT